MKSSALQRVRELAAKWARAKRQEDVYREAAESLRKEILEAGAEIGYEDEHLIIGESSVMDLTDARLEEALRAAELLEACSETKLCAKKIRAAAELKPELAEVVKAVTERKPRFEQAAKRK